MTKLPITCAFIDGENMFKSFRSMGYRNIDYVKLYWWLKKRKNAERIFLYAGLVEGDSQRENKYRGLASLGYETKMKKVQIYTGKMLEVDCQCPKCGTGFACEHQMNDRSKANCDAELTVDVMQMCLTNKCDEIIVFSGDGDFSYLYEFVVKELKKKVAVYSPMKYPASQITSHKLKELAKEGHIDLYSLESVAQHRAIPL